MAKVTQQSTHRLDLTGLAASVFFNVMSNGQIKVVKRYNDRDKTLYNKRWMTKEAARAYWTYLNRKYNHA